MSSNEHLASYLCIGCPLGCRLEVEDDDLGNVIEVRGFDCKKGKEYGSQEHIDPRRMVTTTVKANGGIWARLPVKTKDPVPKALVGAVCQALRRVEVNCPITLGTVIMANVLDTGIDVVAASDMAAADRSAR